MSLQLLSLQDQGFEAGIGTWAAQTNCTVAQSATFAQTGTQSLRLSSTAGGTMSAISGNYAVMPGRSFTWSGYQRAGASGRSTVLSLYWFQSDGSTASALHANDDIAGTDTTGAWTQTAVTSVTAPLDAFYVKVRFQVTATGAGAELHYLDTVSLLDANAPFFKSGRLADIWLNGVDVTAYFATADFAVMVETAEVSTMGATFKSYISGLAISHLTASGYYDSADADKVRDTLQAAVGQVTFLPVGANVIGDQARLLNINTSAYKNTGQVGQAVTMDWVAESTAPVGAGEVLHVLQNETGTITGTGSPLLTGVSSATGAIAHLHVTAISGGSLAFKLQDATALNGAYADIASGAFTNVTTTGSQRLVIPGTIRAYVRAVATLGAQTCTYGIAAART